MLRYATTLILASTLIIGEVHTFWEKGSQDKVNWIINSYQPMTMQWNVKFLCDEINVILYFVAFYLYGKYPNRTNKATVLSFLFLAIVDMALYFWNFKTIDYHYVYFCLAVCGWMIYKFGIKPQLRK